MKDGHSAAGVTVLWAAEPALGGALEARCKALAETIQKVPAERLDSAVVQASLKGPVAVVVSRPEDARQALGWGADEVLRADQLSEDALVECLERALVRGRARALRENSVVERLRLDDASALELFASAVGTRAEESLDRAIVRCDALAETMALQISKERGDDISDVSATTLQEIRESVDDALRLVRQMRAMIGSHEAAIADLRIVVWEVTALVRPAVERVAELMLSIPDAACYVGMQRWQLVQAVAALMRNAVNRVAKRGPGNHVVEVRLYEQDDDVVVLEINDDGIGTAPASALMSVSPLRIGNAAGDLGLAVVAARVRQAGGELVIDSDPSYGTSVRLFLPILAHHPRRDDKRPKKRRHLRSVS